MILAAFPFPKFVVKYKIELSIVILVNELIYVSVYCILFCELQVLDQFPLTTICFLLLLSPDNSYLFLCVFVLSHRTLTKKLLTV